VLFDDSLLHSGHNFATYLFIFIFDLSIDKPWIIMVKLAPPDANENHSLYSRTSSRHDICLSCQLDVHSALMAFSSLASTVLFALDKEAHSASVAQTRNPT
jgi:hypothetical protein